MKWQGDKETQKDFMRLEYTITASILLTFGNGRDRQVLRNWHTSAKDEAEREYERYLDMDLNDLPMKVWRWAYSEGINLDKLYAGNKEIGFNTLKEIG